MYLYYRCCLTSPVHATSPVTSTLFFFKGLDPLDLQTNYDPPSIIYMNLINNYNYEESNE